MLCTTTVQNFRSIGLQTACTSVCALILFKTRHDIVYIFLITVNPNIILRILLHLPMHIAMILYPNIILCILLHIALILYPNIILCILLRIALILYPNIILRILLHIPWHIALILYPNIILCILLHIACASLAHSFDFIPKHHLVHSLAHSFDFIPRHHLAHSFAHRLCIALILYPNIILRILLHIACA